jgi:hypothetical protein
LIDLWEDYNFISHCDRIWSFPEYTAKESHNYSQILSQASPQLIRILQAYKLDFVSYGFHARGSKLLNIRLVLNLSWDELRKAIYPLRKIIGEDSYRLRELSNFTPKPALSRTPQCRSIFWDIALGYLPMLRAVYDGRLPAQLRQVLFGVSDMRS